MEDVRISSMNHPTTIGQPASQVREAKPTNYVHAKDSLAPKAQSLTDCISSLIQMVWGWIRNLFQSIFHPSNSKAATPIAVPTIPSTNSTPVDTAPVKSTPTIPSINSTPVDAEQINKNHALFMEIMEKDKASSNVPFCFIQNFPTVADLYKKRQSLFLKIVDAHHELDIPKNQALISEYTVCTDQLQLLIKLASNLELQFKHFDKAKIEERIDILKKIKDKNKIDCSFKNADEYKKVYDSQLSTIRETFANNKITEAALYSPLLILVSAYKSLSEELTKIQFLAVKS